ncbi:signal peptidase II [bacterium]|nr:signal peptidase II [bacterium]
MVFFVESITIIIASICLILCPNNWLYMVSISFVLIGGIMNTNCRASIHEYYEGSYYQLQHYLNPTDPQYQIKNVVIDYWHFNTDKTQYCIFNFNDCCVISGAIGYGLFLFINLLINYAPYLFKQTKKINNQKVKQWNNK